LIIYDGIITKLQSNGGVTVYFNNLLSRIKDFNCGVDCSEVFSGSLKARYFERYRDCLVEQKEGVFHSSYYRLPSNKSLKVVTTVHDFTYEKFVHGPARWVHSWQKNRAIRNSDRIICVSENTARDLMRFCPVDESKIRIIYNGVSDAYYPLPTTGEISNQVLFVGARGGYKNFLLAAEAVAAIPELELHIVGGGPLSKREKQRLDTLLPHRYCWLGRLSDEELNMAYNKAYALLYPSSYEGFGIPIIEAMRAGCPVVAVNVSSIPEVAGEAAVLVEQPSALLFSEALSQIVRLRTQLRQAGFIQAAKFSWDRCFTETLAVYKELL
jgi:mannosyltransferase